MQIIKPNITRDMLKLNNWIAEQEKKKREAKTPRAGFIKKSFPIIDFSKGTLHYSIELENGKKVLLKSSKPIIKETKNTLIDVKVIPYSELEPRSPKRNIGRQLNTFNIVPPTVRQQVKPRLINFSHEPKRITYKNL